MELDQDLTFHQKFLRILNNFLYLVGEWYSKFLTHMPALKNLVESFIEGWIDGKAAFQP